MPLKNRKREHKTWRFRLALSERRICACGDVYTNRAASDRRKLPCGAPIIKIMAVSGSASVKKAGDGKALTEE